MAHQSRFAELFSAKNASTIPMNTYNTTTAITTKIPGKTMGTMPVHEGDRVLSKNSCAYPQENILSPRPQRPVSARVFHYTEPVCSFPLEAAASRPQAGHAVYFSQVIAPAYPPALEPTYFIQDLNAYPPSHRPKAYTMPSTFGPGAPSAFYSQGQGQSASSYPQRSDLPLSRNLSVPSQKPVWRCPYHAEGPCIPEICYKGARYQSVIPMVNPPYLQQDPFPRQGAYHQALPESGFRVSSSRRDNCSPTQTCEFSIPSMLRGSTKRNARYAWVDAQIYLRFLLRQGKSESEIKKHLDEVSKFEDVQNEYKPYFFHMIIDMMAHLKAEGKLVYVPAAYKVKQHPVRDDAMFVIHRIRSFENADTFAHDATSEHVASMLNDLPDLDATSMHELLQRNANFDQYINKSRTHTETLLHDCHKDRPEIMVIAKATRASRRPHKSRAVRVNSQGSPRTIHETRRMMSTFDEEYKSERKPQVPPTGRTASPPRMKCGLQASAMKTDTARLGNMAPSPRASSSQARQTRTPPLKSGSYGDKAHFVTDMAVFGPGPCYSMPPGAHSSSRAKMTQASVLRGALRAKTQLNQLETFGRSNSGNGDAPGMMGNHAQAKDEPAMFIAEPAQEAGHYTTAEYINEQAEHLDGHEIGLSRSESESLPEDRFEVADAMMEEIYGEDFEGEIEMSGMDCGDGDIYLEDDFSKLMDRFPTPQLIRASRLYNRRRWDARDPY